MAARRRPSVRTRLNAEDVSSWVNHNTQQQQRQLQEPTEDEHHVRFVAPPTPTNDDSDDESVVSLTEKPVFLDGGYGWIVVVFSFVMHFILDGSSFCFGILYNEIQKHFHANHFIAMIAPALFLSMPLCIAPFAGISSDLLGCRFSILLGGLICTSSTIAAMLCTSYTWFTIYFGLFCGIGMGFVYNAAIVIVTYYFDKNLGVATATAVSGTGIGTFVYPLYLSFATKQLEGYMTPLNAHLAAYAFGFSIILTIGYFIKDVSWSSDTIAYKEKIFNKIVNKRAEEQYEAPITYIEAPSRRALSLPNLAKIKVDFGSIQSVCEAKADGKIEVPTRSKSVALFDSNKPRMPQIPEYSMINANLANLEHLDLELANSPCTTVRPQRRRVTSKISMSVDQINEIDDEDFKVSNLFHSSSSTSSESSSDDSEMSNDGDSSSSELSEKKLPGPTSNFLEKPFASINTRANSSAPTSARIRGPGTTNTSGGRILASNAIQSRWNTNLLTMGKIPSAPELVARKKRKSLLRSFNPKVLINILKQQKPAYSKVWSNRPFQYLMLSVTCLYAVLDVPYVCFFDYGIEHLSLSDPMAQAIYCSIGLANFFATMVIGRLSDWFSGNASLQKGNPILYIISMLMVASAIFIAQFVRSGYELLTIGVMFGVSVTANYALQSILINLIFDEDRNIFQAAYSTVSMVEGMASFVGPVFFAFVREQTGSYHMVFLLSGVLAFFSAFFAYMSFRKFLKTPEEEQPDRIDLENGLVTNHDVNNRVNGHCNGPENENLLHP